MPPNGASTNTLRVNRAPVLALWMAIVFIAN